jgi:hypothetical protein
MKLFQKKKHSLVDLDLIYRKSAKIKVVLVNKYFISDVLKKLICALTYNHEIFNNRKTIVVSQKDGLKTLCC